VPICIGTSADFNRNECRFASGIGADLGRNTQRLAFIPSKFRNGVFPEPFCIEVELSEKQAWSLNDVTSNLVTASDDAINTAKQKEEKRTENAVEALEAESKTREAQGKPLLKTEAVEYLKDKGIGLIKARQLIDERSNFLWHQVPLPGGKKKGRPIAILPYSIDRDTSISSTELQSNRVKPIPPIAKTTGIPPLQSKSGLN
jgi:hypothetical protein